MPNVELVFAGSKQILGKLEVRLAGLLMLRGWKDKFSILDQAYCHGEDAHQESSILSGTDQASLGDRDKFLGRILAKLLTVL